jgi:2,4-dienoyl-CoA reductase (NADPH2)
MASSGRFEKLLEPYHIGAVKTRNRIIKTASGMFLWHEDELAMNEKIKSYYGSIARGGVGLLIVESATIDWPYGRRWRERYRIDDDRYIKGLSELTKIIHGYGCPAFIQLVHEGPWQTKFPFMPEPLFEGPPVGASPISLNNPNDFHNEAPRALTISEIEELVDKFASAAVRCAKAGFDGVDINAASTHLLHNFLSPFWNRRTDIYGGSPENRARFLVQIIQEIKKRLGQDFAVEVIINGMEIGQAIGVDNSTCLTPEYARKIAKLLEAAGADAIQVRSHWLGFHQGSFLPEAFFYPEPPVQVKSMPKEYNASHKGAGANIRLAAGIKKEVGIPVIVVGRLDADLGEQILREGKTDFIGMTRRLQADPDYPNKLMSNRVAEIAPCTACDTCLGANARCRINPFLGAEYNTIDKAPRRKKVVVVGGGPAGMEAARVSALRGHDVTLFEKANKLGGLLHIAATVKGDHPEDLLSIVRYFESQLRRLKVNVKLGKKADLYGILEEKPDAVIIATGGSTVIPQVTGISGRHVVNGAELHRKLRFFLRIFEPRTLRFLSRFFMPLGKRIAIIGGGLHGCELAEFLTKRGRKVTIIESSDTIGKGMVDLLLNHLIVWFQKKGVVLKTSVKQIEIVPRGVAIIMRDGSRSVIEVDTVVPAVPLSADTNLYGSLEGKVPEVHAVGDCKEPLLIVDAVSAGSRVARAI